MSLTPTISKDLIQWYEVNKRDLPWRKTRDPYIIWVSEIIMQQTRVDQGISFFERFIDAFPNLRVLAQAKEQDVLNLWQGLGYYSRARNMHASAQIIVNEHNGQFPEEYNDIIKLKGIGEYTAAAILSFAFKKPFPVIDGNVIRVITRLFGIDRLVTSKEAKDLIAKRVNQVFNKDKADIFNQAIMEFGALQCVPSNPNCGICPFTSKCISHNTGMVKRIPLKKIAKTRKDRYFNYDVIKIGREIVLKKRIEKDIWQNMYDFPMIEKTESKSVFRLEDLPGYAAESLETYSPERTSDWKIHILSHQNIHARFYEYNIGKTDFQLADTWELTDFDKIGEFPLPKLIETYINGM